MLKIPCKIVSFHVMSASSSYDHMHSLLMIITIMQFYLDLANSEKALRCLNQVLLVDVK